MPWLASFSGTVSSTCGLARAPLSLGAEGRQNVNVIRFVRLVGRVARVGRCRGGRLPACRSFRKIGKGRRRKKRTRVGIRPNRFFTYGGADSRPLLCLVAWSLGRFGFEKNVMRRYGNTVIRYSSYLVDPASSHMLVSKIKPCMSKFTLVQSETANGSLNQSRFLR